MLLPIEVTDLKQYAYCARIVFYRYCLPAVRPVTYKMQAGIEAHSEEAEREERRSLRPYGLSSGQRFFDISLRSDELGVRGRLDMAIATPERSAPNAEVIPVEYKFSERTPGRHFKLQLAMYGLLLEAAWGLPVRRGFLYMIPLRQATSVALTPALRRQALAELKVIRDMVAREHMPDPPASRRPCVGCEFRRFCNDVI
ncbi:MAG TPA: CRISPR-associated protein Cas4 [Herpetosiphonaceae bacterium]|nr:CRISPR-associated protein Cas4 [Herpetosiphonaceae bacterium]